MTSIASIQSILTNVQDGILTLQINRPERKNALTAAMYAALAEAVGLGERNSAVRVMLLTGTENCFTSGNDLADFMDNPPTDDNSPVFRFLTALAQAKKPILAAVNGPAIGIGTTLLLHCDLVYAGASATFRLPFSRLGLCPEAGSSLLLPLRIGYSRAAELMLLGEPFTAERALALGLVNGVYDTSTVVKEALQKARHIAAQPFASVLLTKALMKQGNAEALQAVMSVEGKHFIERLQSPEAAEAFQAFLEHRQPDFSRFQ
jgi:enoyl-CoA hydratase/carnithine racemase